METSTAGRFIWHDLDTTDAEGALDFYRSVLGWEAVAFEGGPMPYWTWNGQGGRAGGVCQLTDEARAHGGRPGWTGYVETPDVDRDTARAVELGGRVVMEAMTLPTVGRMSVIEDPQGARIALFAPEPNMGGAGAPDAGNGSRIGAFAWNDLPTTDADGAFAFYSELFGWRESQRIPMGEMGPYRIFAADGAEQGGIFRGTAPDAGAPSWLYYVQVADLGDVLERVRAHGGEVTYGVVDVPGGRVAQCRDPQGSAFGIYEEDV
jgi:hypothetical protein